MTSSTIMYPKSVATEVSARRPDLAANDAIAAVLTADPTLTADEVIEALDDAAAEFAAEFSVQVQSDTAQRSGPWARRSRD